ncbi:hypothetical protein BH24BAC1_BH24BAC1_02930 [soil metagenome]
MEGTAVKKNCLNNFPYPKGRILIRLFPWLARHPRREKQSRFQGCLFRWNNLLAFLSKPRLR